MITQLRITMIVLCGLAGCADDGARCDPNQRLFHGLCYAIDAGAPDAARDAAPAAVTPPGGPGTPPDPRSGSGA